MEQAESENSNSNKSYDGGGKCFRCSDLICINLKESRNLWLYILSSSLFYIGCEMSTKCIGVVDRAYMLYTIFLLEMVFDVDEIRAGVLS